MRIPAGAAHDDPQLRHRHARLPLADLRRGRPRARPTRCSATAACCCSRSTPPAATRRPTGAPVGVRLIPVIEDLSLEATDGTLLRRSPPGALPRPRPPPARAATAGAAPRPAPATPTRPAATPTRSFPPDQCLVAGCAARITPEYSFTSSDPDIADFVRQDPASTNLRKPFLDADDKVVTDNASGLLCPFNAGTTTVTVSAGGFSYSEQVTVLAGSVQRPCGTRPLRPDRFKRASAVAAPPRRRLRRRPPPGQPAARASPRRLRHPRRPRRRRPPPPRRRHRAARPVRPASAASRSRRSRRSCRPRRRRSCGRCRPAAPRRAPTRSRKSAKRRRRSRSRRPSRATSPSEGRPHVPALPARPGPARRARRRLGARRPRRPPPRRRPHPSPALTPTEPEGAEPRIADDEPPHATASSPGPPSSLALGAFVFSGVGERRVAKRQLPGPSLKPRKFGLLRLEREKKFPASVLPRQGASTTARRRR